MRPSDPTPAREYSRLLIADGDTKAADSVLRQAQKDVGTGRGFEYELAQLRAAIGLWDLAAQSWREAVEDECVSRSGRDVLSRVGARRRARGNRTSARRRRR